MSSVAANGAPLDIGTTRQVPLWRLIRVEMRKMGDTRAGMWLLIGVAAITALVMTIFLLNAPEEERTFRNFMTAAGFPQGFLLPVLGILLITSEWSQRTALVSFTLEPVRLRLLEAKLIAAVLFGLAAVLVAFLIASLATAVGGNEAAWDDFSLVVIGKFGILQAIGILQGLAFGMIILNSGGAIATFFILPMAFQIVANLWSPLRDIAPWVDIGTAQAPLLEAGAMTGTEWARVGVASLIWIGVPLLAGLYRVLRREVK